MFRVAFFSLMLMACSFRAPQVSPVTSSGPSVGLFSYWVDIDSGEHFDLNGAFDAALLDALSERGFTGISTDVSTEGDVRGLEVKAKASLFSQLQGQFRWVVSVEATLVQNSQSEPTTETISVDIPVYLRYQHQGEAEAFEAAAPALERALTPLLSDLR
jgi:hypothetical protein